MGVEVIGSHVRTNKKLPATQAFCPENGQQPTVIITSGRYAGYTGTVGTLVHWVHWYSRYIGTVGIMVQ